MCEILIWSLMTQTSCPTPTSLIFFYITVCFLNKMDNQVHNQKPSLAELKLNASFQWPWTILIYSHL